MRSSSAAPARKRAAGDRFLTDATRGHLGDILTAPLHWEAKGNPRSNSVARKTKVDLDDIATIDRAESDEVALPEARLRRREFIHFVALSPTLANFLDAKTAAAAEQESTARARILFTSQGRTGIVDTDGGNLRYFDFQVPGQATWQPGPSFADGKRLVFLSMEPRRDGPGRPFAEFYTQTPTHLWVHDLESGTLDEICAKDRLAPFVTPALLLGNDRILVQVVCNQVGQIYNVRLDGTDAREFTRAGEGLPYGLSLSPDGQRVAFHLASPQGYQVWTCDIDGLNRVRIARRPEHLYFGTSWSPDGRWIVYVDCLYRRDPGHDWADVCIGRADGSEHRVLTRGQAMWFAATYGDPKTRGGGSNVPAWTHDGCILFPRRLPESKVAWEFQPQRPDVDHFNRDYKPELARGGTEICRIDPRDGSVTTLTHSDAPVWNFRASESPDGKQIVFCRAATGGAPEIWLADADGMNPFFVTRGRDDNGADHPRWL
jgi:TolB protein